MDCRAYFCTCDNYHAWAGHERWRLRFTVPVVAKIFGVIEDGRRRRQREKAGNKQWKVVFKRMKKTRPINMREDAKSANSRLSGIGAKLNMRLVIFPELENYKKWITLLE